MDCKYDTFFSEQENKGFLKRRYFYEGLYNVGRLYGTGKRKLHFICNGRGLQGIYGGLRAAIYIFSFTMTQDLWYNDFA